MPQPSLSTTTSVTLLQRENERLRRAVRELSVLNEVAREIGAARDPDAVTAAIVHHAVALVGAEEGIIALADPEETDRHRTLYRGMDGAGSGHHRITQWLMAWMHVHKQPLRLDENSRDHRFGTFVDREAVHSILVVPLLVKGALIGILGAFNKQGRAPFTDEDQRLLTILAAQGAQVIDNARLWEQEQTLRRLQNELDVARAIQVRALPPALPALAGYDLAAVSQPAEQVGGDFYDAVALDGRRLALCVGDVAGKGLTAALVTAQAQAVIHAHLQAGRPLAEAVTRANQTLYERTDRRIFVTLFACVVDVVRGAMYYVNAGHNRPLWCRPGRAPVALEEASLAVALRAGHRYEAAARPLRSGEALVIYSDGITEAMSPDREEFGEERLRQVLQQHEAMSAAELRDAVMRAVRRHAGGARVHDDMTLLVAKRA